MQYQAYVRKFSYEWYEGTLSLEIDDISLAVTYTVNCDEFAEKHLKIGSQIAIDLWLRYCSKVEFLPPGSLKCFPTDQRIAGGDVQGQVTAILDVDSFRLDCGVMAIDVKSEEGIVPQVGQIVRVRGTYHVFFPDTECSYENLGLM